MSTDGNERQHILSMDSHGNSCRGWSLNFAYETALTALQTEQTPNVAKALFVLSQKAGIYGMVVTDRRC